MKLKLNRIVMKPFVMVATVVNVVAGLLLGLVVTVVAIVAPNEQAAAGAGAWSILVFPVLNGLIGCATAVFLSGLYNLLAPRLGGLVFDFEDAPSNG